MDMPPLTPVEAGLTDALGRLARVVRALAFIVCHLGAALVLIALAWATTTTPAQLWHWVNVAADSRPALFLGLAGLSLVSLATLYMRLWRLLYSWLIPKRTAT